jgi:hypothetical protein
MDPACAAFQIRLKVGEELVTKPQIRHCEEPKATRQSRFARALPVEIAALRSQ